MSWFSLLQPLGRFSIVTAMSICLYVVCPPPKTLKENEMEPFSQQENSLKCNNINIYFAKKAF